MEGSEKGDDVLPFGVVARELERGFNRLGAGVPVINLVRAGHGRNLGEAFGERNHALVVEVGARHVDQFARLPLYRSDYVRMAMAGRSDGDAGRKIEELVAVYVFDDQAAAAFCDHGIRAGVGR